jgi:hypothetical protein
MIDGIDFANLFQHPSTISSSLIYISTYVNDKYMKLMIDTGSQQCFINKNCLKYLDQLKYSSIKAQQFFMADGLTSITVTGMVTLRISIGNVVTSIGAFITTNLCTNIILGMNYLLKYDLEIHPKKKSIIFNFNDQKIILPIDSELPSNQSPSQFSNSIKLTSTQQLNTITPSSYNTGVHSTTNFSPFELTFGRRANLPTDSPPTTFTFQHPNDYFHQLVRNLKSYHQTAKEIMLKQQQKTKARFDLHRLNPQYELGTTVLTRIFTNRSKLDPRYSINPKIIVDKKHPIYFVEDINTKIISKVHVSDIRPLSSHSNN